MFKLVLADGNPIQLAAAAASGASAAGVGWLALVGEWSMGLFGVPVSVLLCASIGAFGALSLMEVASIRQAIASSFTSMMVAAVGTPLALHLANGGAPPPMGLAPAVAIVAAVGLQLILPWLFVNGGRTLTELCARAMDKYLGRRGGDDAR